MRYAFIGLGNLGACLAGSLLRAGFEVVATDLDRGRGDALVAAGARWADAPEAAVAEADAAITCLPSPAASEAVLRRILPHLPAGADWIETSTVGREDVLRLAAIAEEAGVSCLECPVTGGVHLAASGRITILVGGDAAVMARHRPALDAMGAPVIHMGPLGSASLIKVITNMLAFIHLAASAEALMLAKRGGLDLATAWSAIAHSSGSSFVHETEGRLILNGSYDVGFSMDLALKDLGFAREFGRLFESPLDLAAHVEQVFVRARAAYGGDAQSPRIAQLLEDLLGTDLRAPGFPAKLVDEDPPR